MLSVYASPDVIEGRARRSSTLDLRRGAIAGFRRSIIVVPHRSQTKKRFDASPAGSDRGPFMLTLRLRVWVQLGQIGPELGRLEVRSIKIEFDAYRLPAGQRVARAAVNSIDAIGWTSQTVARQMFVPRSSCAPRYPGAPRRRGTSRGHGSTCA